jgi:DNA replicative helicase MCM subunit Mcm2 (Cdc46/Mcm family)
MKAKKAKKFKCDNCEESFDISEQYYAGTKDGVYCKACAYHIAKINKGKNIPIIDKGNLINFHNYTIQEIIGKITRNDILKNESVKSSGRLLEWLVELCEYRSAIDNIKIALTEIRR